MRAGLWLALGERASDGLGWVFHRNLLFFVSFSSLVGNGNGMEWGEISTS